MKKFLLSCLVALGIGTKAQINYTADFEDPNYNTTRYVMFTGSSRTAAAACNGAFGGQILPTTTVASSGGGINLSQIAQTNLGQKLSVTANYKKAATVAGTLSLAFFENIPGTTSWNIYTFGTPVALDATAITTCTSLTGEIPSGFIEPGKTYGVGVWFVRSGTANGNVYIDDIHVQEELVSTIPSCASLAAPIAGSTVSGGNINFQWNYVPTAVGYKLKVGTTSGGSEIFTADIRGGKTSYNGAVPVNGGPFYASVTPYNANGDAVGCSEITFNTDGNISYCGPITSTSPTGTYPISSVTVNGGTPNTSSNVVGSPAYEDFSSTVFNVTGANNMTLNVAGTGVGTNRFGMTVFIDWNNNGSFYDAGEQYFTTAPFVGGTGATVNLTGNIAVPDNINGNRRMRIKYNFNSSATSVGAQLADPCGPMSNGQAEDYTLAVSAPTVVPVCTTVTTPTEGATIPANATFAWTATPNAAGYKLYLGTTAGGTDVLNGTLVTGTSYSYLLTAGTTYYLRVIPTNSVGDATGCTEISFTAGNLQYCAITYGSVEPMSNLTFAGINNNSPLTGAPGYENFTTITGNVTQGETLPISVNGTSSGNYFNAYIVFIDWNQNGKLDDAGEMYFGDASLNLTNSNGTGAPATGNIAIPADAKPGNARMRIKKEYYGSQAGAQAAVNFKNPCVNGASFGQAEDYTIHVTASTPACTTITSPTNGAVDVAIDASLTWEAVTGTTGYKVYIGTTSGGTDIVNGTEVTTTDFAMNLSEGTLYYAKVVPTNSGVDATGCTEISFTTVTTPVVIDCTTITSPTNGAVDVAIDASLTWAAVTGATGYKVYIGTTSGGTDVVNGTEVTTTDYAMSLAPGTLYYAKVVPTNANGDATGCPEISFTTAAAVSDYCGPLTYNTVEPTTNITFAGINNTTSATVNGSPAHEFFLDQVAEVNQNGSYTISMNANTDGASFRHFFAVFIDWNQDKDFDDEGEKYFVTAGNLVFVLGSNGVTGTPATGTITVPQGATLGQTRMRIKSAWYPGATGPSANPTLLEQFADPCITTGSTFGQVEDYTVNVSEEDLAVSGVDKNKVSLYPNPFSDVLRISDVKEVKSVVISDMVGRQIATMKPSSELRLAHLNSGTYIVTLVMENGTVNSYKVIKK